MPHRVALACVQCEDVFYVEAMSKVSASVAPRDVALRFSVESVLLLPSLASLWASS